MFVQQCVHNHDGMNLYLELDQTLANGVSSLASMGKSSTQAPHARLHLPSVAGIPPQGREEVLGRCADLMCPQKASAFRHGSDCKQRLRSESPGREPTSMLPSMHERVLHAAESGCLSKSGNLVAHQPRA